MSSKIILDTKNANTNQPSTSLASRFIGNRDAYRQGSLCFSQGEIEYLLFSINNSKIAWSINPTKTYPISLTGKTLNNLYEYKVDTLDAIKDTTLLNASFSKPYFLYYDQNTLNEAEFTLEEPLFHWTRNDSTKQRFDWDGQNWKLLKGGSSVSLGILTPDQNQYQLPKGIIDENNVFVNLIYVGQDPSNCTAPITKKLSTTPDPFSFDSSFDAVIFVDQNVVQFKDSFITANAGKEIWFFNESFGVLDGVVNNSWLSPKPQGFESPLLRLGNREYLSIQFYETDDDLPNTINDNIAYISKDTGKVLYNNPNNYTLYYDGVVLSSKPISFISPIEIIDEKITPKSLLSAGFDVIPDGTGRTPNGDNPTSSRPDASGLKIAVLNKYNYAVNNVGDLLDVDIIPTYDDLPNDLKWGKGYLTLVKNPADFTINVNFKPSFLSFQQSKNRTLYFVQSSVALKSYALHDNKYLIYSAKQDSFTITGGTLRLVVDGITRNLSFNSLTGYKTANEIQNYFDTLLSNDNPIKAENRYLVIKANTSLEILDTSDLSVLQDLGFVAQTITDDWYLSTGLYYDLQATQQKNSYDFTASILYDNIEVVNKILPSTFAFLDFTPREDYDGYATNTFFKVGKNTLEPDVEIQHLFNENKFAWIRNISRIRKIETPTNILELEAGVVDNSTTITLTKDKTSNTLIEGDTFDTNIAGYARTFSKYSKQIDQGYNATINEDQYTIQDNQAILTNDWIQTGSDFFKVINVDNNTLSLSSTPTDTSWKAFKGYSEPDPTLLSAECFISLNNVRSFLKVKKIHYVGVFNLKEIITLKCATESNLIARWSDNTEQNITILKEQTLGLTNETCFVDITDNRVLGLHFKIRVEDTLYTPVFDDTNEDVSINSITGEITFSNTILNFIGDVVFIPLAYQNIEVLISNDFTSEFYNTNKPSYIVEEIPHNEYVVETTGGNISFLSPLDTGISLEVEYYTDENTQIVEPILFTIQNEITTKISSSKYSFNPNTYIIEQSVNPVVSVGAEVIGFFDPTSQPIFNYVENTLTLPSPNTNDYDVKISYSIKQAVGGEYTIKVVNPIWLPLLQISKGSSSLNLYGDFTDIVKPNSVIKSTSEFFVVDTATFANGKTTITFDNPAKFDSGARSPSDDPKIYVLSNENIFISLTTLIGNDNYTIIAKPLSSTISISEDLTSFIQENTLIFLDTDCYQVKSVKLSDDLTRTIITFTSVLNSNIQSSPNITLSARPVYLQGDTLIKGKGAFLSDYEFKLIKYSNGMGTALTLNYDYSINESNGQIQLNLNHSIQPDISYYFFHTKPNSLSPFLSNGRLIYPTYKATFNQYIESPYTDKKLFAKCVINANDQFYLRCVEQDEYEAEISFDTPLTTGRSKSFIDQPKGVGQDIYDNLAKDVIARENLSTLNQIITNLENLDPNRSVGDQDGSFKFEIIQATSDYFSAGIEDPLTREIQPRYVALENLNAENINTFILPTDPILLNAIYDPIIGNITGTTPSSKEIDDIINNQKPMIFNDVDDIVLTDVKPISSYYFLGIKSTLYFIWKSLSQNSTLSRIFPAKTKSAYFLMDGDFNFLDTFGKRIGTISNPLFNPITNISSLSIQKRIPAFFVFDYSPTGYQGISTKPTFILSAVPLYQFPINNLGMPDTALLIYQDNPNGSVYSISSGNPDLVIPPLNIGSILAINDDANNFIAIKDQDQPITGDFRNATIEDIIDGCYVVLNTSSPIIDGVTLTASQGQTIIHNVTGGDSDATEIQTPFYRIGFDVNVNYSTGAILDNSFPSSTDPNFPIQEILNQNPPDPNECLEGDVFFNYQDTKPFENLPALNGLDLNDSGLLSIPYINSTGKETFAINNTTRAIKHILENDYLYPDEIRFDLNINTTTGTLNDPIPTGITENDLVFFQDKSMYQSSSTNFTIPRLNYSSTNIYYKLSNFIAKQNAFTVSTPTLSAGVWQYQLSFNQSYDFQPIFNNTDRQPIFNFILNQSITNTYCHFSYLTGTWHIKTNDTQAFTPIYFFSISTNTITFKSSSYLFSTHDITLDSPMTFTTSFYNFFNDDGSIPQDRCSFKHDSIELSFFQPTATTFDSVLVQTELRILSTTIPFYNTATLSTDNQALTLNNHATANDSQPFTFYDFDYLNNTLLIPPFFGHGNSQLSSPTLQGIILSSSTTTLPVNQPAYLHHSSDSNYFNKLWNLSTDYTNTILPNDLVFFDGISLIAVVQDVQPTYITLSTQYAPSILNADLATPNTNYSSFTNNLDLYLFPITLPNDLTLPVSFSIRRPRRFAFSSILKSPALSLKPYYLRIEIKASSITNENPFLNSIYTFNTPLETSLLSLGDILVYDFNTPFARIVKITHNTSFTIMVFDQSVSINSSTYYYVYKQTQKPIEQAIIQLTSILSTPILSNSSSNIPITTQNEFTLPITYQSYFDNGSIQPNQYLFIYPNTNGQAKPNTTLLDNRGLYLISSANNTTRTLSLSPIIGSQYLSYDNAYPDDYTFDLNVTGAEDLNITKWSIFSLNNSYTDLSIISYLLYERLLSFIYNVDSLFNTAYYPASWQDFFSNDLYDTFTNIELNKIAGNYNTLPYTSTLDGLSLLDRRFFIEDLSMINDDYLIALPNGLKSFLEDTIVQNGLREDRYYWLNIRTNKVNGLAKA